MTIRSSTRTVRRGSALSLAALLVAACGGGAQTGGDDPPAAGEEQRLSIATGGTSGVYYVYGGGLANVLSQNVEGMTATAEATSASVDNMLLIGNGGSDLAFVLADTATDAVQGETESFTEPIEASALANLYTNYTQVVALADSGITDIASLEGRTVSVGAPGSGTEVIALRVLGAAGLDPQNDISPVGLSVAESVAALRDGSIEAFFWSGGLPTAGITDLATSDEIVLLSTTEYLSALQEEFGEAYEEHVVPAGTYSGYDEEVGVIGVPNLLMVNNNMNEETAYQITKTLFEQQEALTQVHPEAANLDMETAQETGEIELHPGAQRYYDEAGS